MQALDICLLAVVLALRKRVRARKTTPLPTLTTRAKIGIAAMAEVNPNDSFVMERV